MATLYQHTRALNGVNVKSASAEMVTISAEEYRALKQIVSDVATTYKTDNETLSDDELLERYEDIGFYAMLTAQSLSIPYNPTPGNDEDEERDEDERYEDDEEDEDEDEEDEDEDDLEHDGPHQVLHENEQFETGGVFEGNYSLGFDRDDWS